MSKGDTPAAESSEPNPEHIAELMHKLRHGDKEAAGQLVAVFYPELRRMARSRMRSERTPHTWQPTILVNELYLELLKIKALRPEDAKSDRQAFLGLAAHMMKRMLIHHARPLYRQADAVEASEGLEFDLADPARLVEIEDLLARLSHIDPQLRTIVEMRVFEGFSIEEIALQLSCAPRTIDRRWSFARKWLAHQLAPESQPQ